MDDVLKNIDIASLLEGNKNAQKRIGDQIVDAGETLGFFTISGYESILPADFIERSFDLSRAYFAKPDSVKLANEATEKMRFQGYEPPNDKDTKEAYIIGPERSADDARVKKGDKYHGANQWPADMPEFKAQFSDVTARMLDLSRHLNRALALGLDAPKDYFDQRSKDPMCALRMLHYAPSPAGEGRDGIAPHTDWGALSLLLQQDVSGLEVQRPDGTWFEVPARPDRIVVNLGELIARWTNDRLKATPHRVKPDVATDRYSIAFFLDMDAEAMIKTLSSCINNNKSSVYDPILVQSFIEQMHKRDYPTQDVA